MYKEVLMITEQRVKGMLASEVMILNSKGEIV